LSPHYFGFETCFAGFETPEEYYDHDDDDGFYDDRYGDKYEEFNQ